MIGRPEIARATIGFCWQWHRAAFPQRTHFCHTAQQFACGRTDDHLSPLHVPWSPDWLPPSPGLFLRSTNGGELKIEGGMKVAVRRDGQEKIGVLVRLDSDYVVVRWTRAERPEELEFCAHRDDVTPLAGWV